MRHFSQGNPAGPGQDDVPALLRRIAESIEQLGQVWIQDLVLHNEVTADGDWYSQIPSARALNRLTACCRLADHLIAKRAAPVQHVPSVAGASDQACRVEDLKVL